MPGPSVIPEKSIAGVISPDDANDRTVTVADATGAPVVSPNAVVRYANTVSLLPSRLPTKAEILTAL